MENNRNRAAILIVVIAIAVIVVLAVMLFGGGENTEVTTTPNTDREIDYELEEEMPTGNKEVEEQVLEGVIIEKSDIIYSGNMSKLTTKVTNDSEAKTNFRFNIYFLDDNGDTIAEALGYVGDLSANEVRYIEASVTKNVSEIADVRYEVIK